jgi:hypothetical protein
MKLRDLINQCIVEASIKSIRPTQNISDGDKKKSYEKLSSTELQQLRREGYVPHDIWPTFRQFLLDRSIASNDSLNPELTAYTPGETIHLLNNSIISGWLNDIKSFKVADEFSKIVFVPCAKTKPWENATRGIYKDYNRVRKEHPNLFFVTISEPLAIVPQTLWNNFPQYDNPGLFKDTVQRSGGLFTRDFKTHFGVDRQYKVPFDESAYNKSIDILASTIRSFIENNRDKDMISFVEDFHGTSTHSDMLTKAGFTGKRLTKRRIARSSPYDHIIKNIQ